MTEHIPRDFIDQLLNRVDIVDLIDGRITLRKKTGNNFFACCPFHNSRSAKSNSFIIALGAERMVMPSIF
jgi:DNA primase